MSVSENSFKFVRFQRCHPYFHICSGGRETGVADFFVYTFFLNFPWTYTDVYYVVGKAFSKEIQRRQNRGKRFRGDKVIRKTGLTNMNYGSKSDVGTQIDLL